MAHFSEKIPDKKFVFFDFKTAAEFAEGHIPNAVNIDIYSDYFTADVSALDKSFEYAIYCRSGKRSVDAATVMDEIGFSTSNLTGGIISWVDANKEITC